jgi:hypothetical protein
MYSSSTSHRIQFNSTLVIVDKLATAAVYAATKLGLVG